MKLPGVTTVNLTAAAGEGAVCTLCPSPHSGHTIQMPLCAELSVLSNSVLIYFRAVKNSGKNFKAFVLLFQLKYFDYLLDFGLYSKTAKTASLSLHFWGHLRMRSLVLLVSIIFL